MRRALILVASWAGLIVACSTFSASSIDSAQDAAAADATADAAPDAPLSDGPAPPDDGAIPDADAADGGAVLRDDFESGNCDGWMPLGGGTIVWQSGTAHGGTGACLVTLPSGASSVQKVVALPGPGTYELDVYVREVADGGGSASATLAWTLTDGGSGGNSNTVPVGSSYGLLQVVASEPGPPNQVVVVFSTTSPPSSYYIDDVTVVRQK